MTLETWVKVEKVTNRAVVYVIAEFICYEPAHRLTPFYMLF